MWKDVKIDAIKRYLETGGIGEVVCAYNVIATIEGLPKIRENNQENMNLEFDSPYDALLASSVSGEYHIGNCYYLRDVAQDLFVSFDSVRDDCFPISIVDVARYVCEGPTCRFGGIIYGGSPYLLYSFSSAVTCFGEDACEAVRFVQKIGADLLLADWGELFEKFKNRKVLEADVWFHDIRDRSQIKRITMLKLDKYKDGADFFKDADAFWAKLTDREKLRIYEEEHI